MKFSLDMFLKILHLKLSLETKFCILYTFLECENIPCQLTIVFIIKINVLNFDFLLLNL